MKNKKEFKVQYMPLGMSIGISIGVAVGAAMKNIPICMSVGLSIGMCVGVMIDYINSIKKEKDTVADEELKALEALERREGKSKLEDN